MTNNEQSKIAKDTHDSLPALPEPQQNVWLKFGPCASAVPLENYYTADQMHAYARAAIEALQQQAETVGWLSLKNGRHCYFHGAIDPREVHDNGGEYHPLVYTSTPPAQQAGEAVATVGRHWDSELGFDLNDFHNPRPPYGTKLYAAPPCPVVMGDLKVVEMLTRVLEAHTGVNIDGCDMRDEEVEEIRSYLDSLDGVEESKTAIDLEQFREAVEFWRAHVIKQADDAMRQKHNRWVVDGWEVQEKEANRLLALIDSTPAAPSRGGWLPIESAPEQQWILVCSGNGIVVDIAMLEVEDGERRWFTDPPNLPKRYYRDGTFTHWQPLPPPPSKSEVGVTSNAQRTESAR